MRLELLLGGKKQQVNISGDQASIGGTEQDTVRVLGAPPKLVELKREGEGWLLRTRVQGRINGVPFAALVPRIWMPGETLSMGPGLSVLHLKEDAGAVPGTAAVAKDLLGSFEPPAATALPVLICLTGIESGRRFPLSADHAIIGRAEDVAVRLRDSSVSRRHAKVARSEAEFFVDDLDSPNGVFVNGRRIRGRAALPDGAVIEIGQTVLRFQLPDPVAPAAAPVAPATAVPVSAPPVATPGASKLLAADEPVALPMVAEPEAKLQLVPPPKCDADHNDSAEQTSPSKNQLLRLSAIGARLRMPKVPSFSALEWTLVGAGAALMILGALVSWTFLG